MDESPAPLPPEALAYYAGGREARRLGEGHGPLEFARTCDTLERWLPGPPALTIPTDALSAPRASTTVLGETGIVSRGKRER